MDITVEQQAANAIEWLVALLSGKYKQGKGYLEVVSPEGEHSFCCWGVLCSLMNRIYYPDITTWDNDVYHSIGFDTFSGEISPNLVTKEGEVNDSVGYDNLGDANDSGVSFTEIANYLITNAATNFNEYVANAITNHFKDWINGNV